MTARDVAPSPRAGERWATGLTCSRSGTTAPLDEPAFLSPAGAPWLVSFDLDPERGKGLLKRLTRRPWSMWRYRELLPLADFDTRVDLGEGGTPLVRLRRVVPAGTRVWFKEESGNPTGSFKARGLSMAVNRARELGAPGVELASAGNAALALAAYSTAAGLPCRVAFPEDTPPTIGHRCRLYGAEVLTGGRTLVESGAELAKAAEGGPRYWNLSTLKEPYRLEGKKTMGLELAEQFEFDLPEWIFYPTGGGTGIIGMAKAFDELEDLGLLGPKRPRFVSVQMAGCAPIVKAFREGRESAEPWPDPVTRAWGLRVPQAIGDFLILRTLRESGGSAVAVDEEAIDGARQRLARQEGRIGGPEGLACLVAYETLAREGSIVPDDRVVLFQTGHPGNYE